MLLKLFSSYKPEEVVNAQLYMHIEVDEKIYKRSWNVQVYQTGMLSFKLKRKSKGSQSQYFMCHTTRIDTTTNVTFESIAAVYNKLKFAVKLGAWKKKIGQNEEMERHDEIMVNADTVGVIPITWFENQYLIKVANFD